MKNIKTLKDWEEGPIKPFYSIKQGEYSKRFPADINQEHKDTFLMNTKIKDRLYSYLLMHSITRENTLEGEKYYVTSVEDLPKWAEMKTELKYNNKKTYNNHLKALELAGYIKVIEVLKKDKSGYTVGYQFLKPEQDNFFFEMTNNTIRIMLNCMSENIFKAYLYIGRKFEYNKSKNTPQFNYVTLVEVGEHFGLKKDIQGMLNSKKQYQAIFDMLFTLHRMKLIKLHKTMVGGRPRFEILDVTHDIYKPTRENEDETDWMR